MAVLVTPHAVAGCAVSRVDVPSSAWAPRSQMPASSSRTAGGTELCSLPKDTRRVSCHGKVLGGSGGRPVTYQPCALMRNCSILTCDRRRRERALSVSERAHVSKHGPQARCTVSLQCLRCCPRSRGPRFTPPAGNSSASCIWLRRRGKAPLKAPLPPSTAQPLAPVSCADAPQTVALTRVNSDCSGGQGPLALDPVYHTA